MLTRCTQLARGTDSQASNVIEANVMRVAGLVIKSRFPEESARLLLKSRHFFQQQKGGEPLPVELVLRQGWIVSLPRLRDMLTEQLRRA